MKILPKTEQSYHMTVFPLVEFFLISELKILKTMSIARSMTKISMFTASLIQYQQQYLPGCKKTFKLSNVRITSVAPGCWWVLNLAYLLYKGTEPVCALCVQHILRRFPENFLKENIKCNINVTLQVCSSRFLTSTPWWSSRNMQGFFCNHHNTKAVNKLYLNPI